MATFIDWLKENKPEYVSYTKRKELAKKLGISNYQGTAEQNMLIWKKLKQGSDDQKKIKIKENKDLTSRIKQLGYIPEEFEERGYGIDPSLYEQYPSEAEYKSQQKKKVVHKKPNKEEFEKWAEEYYKWATTSTGGDSRAKKEDILLAAKYLPSEKASILRYVYNLGDEHDASIAESNAMHRRQEQGIANFPLYVKNGMIRPNYFLEDLKKYQKQYNLTDEQIWKLVNSADAEFKYAAELHTAGSNVRHNKEIEKKNFIKEIHNAQNQFLSTAGEIVGNALNAPSHFVYGGYKAITDPNYTARDFTEGIIADSSKNTSASDVLMDSGEKDWHTTAVDIAFDPLTLLGGAGAAKKLFTNGIEITRTLPAAMLDNYGVKTTFRRMGNNYFNVASGAPRYGRRGKPISGILTPEDDITRLSRNHYLENISPTTQRVGQQLYGPNSFMPGNQNYRYFHGIGAEVPSVFSGVRPFVNPLPLAKQIDFNFQEPLLQENEVVWPEYTPQETTMSYRYEVNPEFEKAFAEARKKGEKFFIWKGKRYGTGLSDDYNKTAITTSWNPGLSEIPGLGQVLITEELPEGRKIIDGTQRYHRKPKPATKKNSKTGVPEPIEIQVEQVKYDKKGGTINYTKLF